MVIIAGVGWLLGLCMVKGGVGLCMVRCFFFRRPQCYCYSAITLTSIIFITHSPTSPTSRPPPIPHTMLLETLQKYIEYTPVKSIYDKVLVDMKYVQSREAFRSETRTIDGYHNTHLNPEEARAILGSVTAVVIISLLVGVAVFVLNIVGIVCAFQCKQVALGVISIIGMFFGLPIGLVYYIVYLCNPGICG